MFRPRVDAGCTFLIAGALASSAAGHRIVEALDKRDAPLAAAYGAYRHVAVGPAIVIAIVLAAVVLGAIVRERHEPQCGRNDALAREAIAVGRMRLAFVVTVVAALQLGLLFAMESVEHAVAFGTPTSGLDWLGGCVPIALGVHIALACLTAVTIRRVCRDVAATCDRVLAFVAALVAYLRPLLERDALARPLARGRRVAIVVPRSSRPHGLRAPPIPA